MKILHLFIIYSFLLSHFVFAQETKFLKFDQLHYNAFVTDLHCDAIMRYLRGSNLAQNLKDGHVDIPKLKAGGIDLQVFACFSPPPKTEKERLQSAKKVLRQIDAVYRLIEANQEELSLITSFEQIDAAMKEQKIGVLIGIEGGYAIENDLALLRDFYRLGVRIMTLTHWTHTDWADASGDTVVTFDGLSPFGEEVVKEMNRLGMIVDISHVHDQTFWDVIRVSTKPVVASHSCCRALSNHHRNLSDDMLRALAQNGGMIGINFEPGYLKVEFWNERNRLRKELAKKYGLPQTREARKKADPKKLELYYQELNAQLNRLIKKYQIDVKLVVDHIEHVIKVTGSVDYVGLGSDFDGISTTPFGLENASQLPNITKELVNRGYSKEDIEKILGKNFLRVFKQVCERQ